LSRQGRQERQEFSVVSQPHFLGALGALGGLKVFFSGFLILILTLAYANENGYHLYNVNQPD